MMLRPIYKGSTPEWEYILAVEAREQRIEHDLDDAQIENTALQAANKKLVEEKRELEQEHTEYVVNAIATVGKQTKHLQELEGFLWELEQHGHPCECTHCEEWWGKYREARDAAMAKAKGGVMGIDELMINDPELLLEANKILKREITTLRAHLAAQHISTPSTQPAPH